MNIGLASSHQQIQSSRKVGSIISSRSNFKVEVPEDIQQISQIFHENKNLHHAVESLTKAVWNKTKIPVLNKKSRVQAQIFKVEDILKKNKEQKGNEIVNESAINKSQQEKIPSKIIHSGQAKEVKNSQHSLKAFLMNKYKQMENAYMQNSTQEKSKTQQGTYLERKLSADIIQTHYHPTEMSTEVSNEQSWKNQNIHKDNLKYYQSTQETNKNTLTPEKRKTYNIQNGKPTKHLLSTQKSKQILTPNLQYKAALLQKKLLIEKNMVIFADKAINSKNQNRELREPENGQQQIEDSVLGSQKSFHSRLLHAKEISLKKIKEDNEHRQLTDRNLGNSKRINRNSSTQPEVNDQDLAKNNHSNNIYIRVLHPNPNTQSNGVSGTINPEEITQQLVKQNLMIFNRKKMNNSNNSQNSASQAYMVQQLKIQASLKGSQKQNTNNYPPNTQLIRQGTITASSQIPFQLSNSISNHNLYSNTTSYSNVNNNNQFKSCSNFNNGSNSQTLHSSQEQMNSKKQLRYSQIFFAPQQQNQSFGLSSTTNFYNEGSQYFYNDKIPISIYESINKPSLTRSSTSVPQQRRRIENIGSPISSPSFLSPRDANMNENQTLCLSNSYSISKIDTTLILSKNLQRKSLTINSNGFSSEKKETDSNTAHQIAIDENSKNNLSQKKRSTFPNVEKGQRRSESAIYRSADDSNKKQEYSSVDPKQNTEFNNNTKQNELLINSENTELTITEDQLAKEKRPLTALDNKANIFEVEDKESQNKNISLNLRNQFLAKVIATERRAILERIKSSSVQQYHQPNSINNQNQGSILQNLDFSQNTINKLNVSDINSTLKNQTNRIYSTFSQTNCSNTHTENTTNNNNNNVNIPQGAGSFSAREVIQSSCQGKLTKPEAQRTNCTNQKKYQTEVAIEDEGSQQKNIKEQIKNNKGGGLPIGPWHNESQGEFFAVDDSLDFVQYTHIS